MHVKKFCHQTHASQILFICWKVKLQIFLLVFIHRREPTLPFYDIIRRLESGFGYRELQETSNLAFMNSGQTKDEKMKEWADKVLKLAIRAFRGLPDEHIQKQAVLRCCHGYYN